MFTLYVWSRGQGWGSKVQYELIPSSFHISAVTSHVWHSPLSQVLFKSQFPHLLLLWRATETLGPVDYSTYDSLKQRIRNAQEVLAVSNHMASASYRDRRPVTTDLNKQLFIGFITDVRIKQNDIYIDETMGHLDSQAQKRKISTE